MPRRTQAERQANFATRVKTRLLFRGQTIQALGQSLKPRRPRSTVSVAIHTGRFPKVRRQVQEALGL